MCLVPVGVADGAGGATGGLGIGARHAGVVGVQERTAVDVILIVGGHHKDDFIGSEGYLLGRDVLLHGLHAAVLLGRLVVAAV